MNFSMVHKIKNVHENSFKSTTSAFPHKKFTNYNQVCDWEKRPGQSVTNVLHFTNLWRSRQWIDVNRDVHSAGLISATSSRVQTFKMNFSEISVLQGVEFSFSYDFCTGLTTVHACDTMITVLQQQKVPSWAGDTCTDFNVKFWKCSGTMSPNHHSG